MHLAGGRQVPARDHERLRRQFQRLNTAPLLKTVYPEAGFTTATLINNFNSGNMREPLPGPLGAARSSIEYHERHGPRRKRGTPSRSVPARGRPARDRTTAWARCSDASRPPAGRSRRPPRSAAVRAAMTRPTAGPGPPR